MVRWQKRTTVDWIITLGVVVLGLVLLIVEPPKSVGLAIYGGYGRD